MITLTDIERNEYRNVWVIAELLSGEIQPVTHELIGAARSLADARNSEVWAVVLGSGIGSSAESLYAYGADAVIVVDDCRLNGFQDEVEARVLVRLIKKYKPEVVICGAT
ncbi:MAG TPA: electron transfer flavoprotein subunit alpha, partial [Clostridiales bacterium]|nr:electron transfer flavoprotein subunit alpha [Clostridiales bacterium]